MKNVRTFQVLADYHQFYLMDAGAEPQIPDEITEQDMLRRLRTAPHIVVFHTESASQVPVEITFGPEPFDAGGIWEHQAEFGLALPSGTAVLCGCTDHVPRCHRVSVEPTNYNGRAYFSGSAVGGERYLIMLWPAAAQPVAPEDAPRSGAPLS
jgi:hypothetical protein